jgi:Fibronectin type III domain
MQIFAVPNSYASAPVNAPTSLSTSSITKTTVDVSFTAPTNDGGSAITNYEYSFNGSSWTALSPTDAISPVTITGLTANTSYVVYLRAVNVVGTGPASSATSSFTTLGALTVEAFAVAGGGGGGNKSGTGAGGGGGGGQSQSGSINTAIGTYTATVGGGGGATGGGGNSSITFSATTISSNGGGAGGTPTTAGTGGTGSTANGSAGSAGLGTGTPSVGGAGTANSFNGTSVIRSAGGCGGTVSSGYLPAFGVNGGGDGGNFDYQGTVGAANRGGGGGGGGNLGTGNSGGSGVVIVRYTTSAATGLTVTGGSISTSGSYTVHTFTSTANFVIS